MAREKKYMRDVREESERNIALELQGLRFALYTAQCHQDCKDCARHRSVKGNVAPGLEPATVAFTDKCPTAAPKMTQVMTKV